MSDVATTRDHSTRNALIVLAVAVVIVLAVVLVSNIQAQRARDVRVDEFYCTLSGVSTYDRGPETGRTCFDLMTD